MYYASDMMKELGVENELDLENILTEEDADIISNGKLNRIIKEHSYDMMCEEIAILYARGSSKDGQWKYCENNLERNVQDWIDANDGYYSALIIKVCNPGHHEITSRESLVVVPNGVHSPLREEEGEVQMEIFKPGVGYLSSYEDCIEEDQSNLD